MQKYCDASCIIACWSAITKREALSPKAYWIMLEQHNSLLWALQLVSITFKSWAIMFIHVMMDLPVHSIFTEDIIEELCKTLDALFSRYKKIVLSRCSSTERKKTSRNEGKFPNRHLSLSRLDWCRLDLSRDLSLLCLSWSLDLLRRLKF